MNARPRIRLTAERLESRYAPAILKYTADSDNGPDEITVRLDESNRKIEVLDDGKLVKKRRLRATERVVISVDSAEGDRLTVDYTPGLFPVPVDYLGSTDAAGRVTAIKTVSVDLSHSAVATTIDIGLYSTEVTFHGGGAITVVGTTSTVVGTDGNDTFIDNTNIELLAIQGGLGNDNYLLRPGSTIVIGDDGGNDTVDFSSNDEAVSADIGTDTTTVTDSDGEVIFDGTVETVVGTNGNDSFIDNTNIELLAIQGGLGNDNYLLRPGSTIVIGDDGGNDTVDFSSNDEAVSADIGTDTTTVTDSDGEVIFDGTVETVVGTNGNDSFIDNTNIELLAIQGGLGDDHYQLNPGSTIVIGDDGGNDTVDFGDSNDPITAELGTDSTRVTDPDGEVVFDGTVETVIGTDNDDVFLDGGEVDYTLSGLGGTDTYDLQPGSTITVIEQDDSRFTFRRARFAIEANLSDGVITDAAKNQVVVVGGAIGSFEGTAFGDVIIGTDGDNVLIGGPGNDLLAGGGGDDRYVLTPDGTDTVADTSGRDTLDFSGSPVGVRVNLGRDNGSPQLIAPGATLVLEGKVEVLIGSHRDDRLFGSHRDDVLIGLGGDDRLQGQAGNDLLLGGSGADNLNGGSGNDILVGGSGPDRLKGGSGEDILIAGYTVYDEVPGSGGLRDQVDLVAWSAIAAAWDQPGPVGNRVASIRAGVGAAGQYRLRASGEDQTVFDDHDPDRLTGGQGRDWFFAQVPGGDVITDKDHRDFLNDL